MRLFKKPATRAGIAIAFTFWMLLCRNANAQPDSGAVYRRILSPVELKEDFGAFRSALTGHHPDIYRYQSPAIIDRLLDSCQTTLTKPMSALAFANLTRFVVSAIQCGHTSANFPGGMLEQYAASVPVLPLKIWFAQGRGYVLCSREKVVAAGSEVLSIDGEPMGKIYENLLRYLPTDGAIRTKKNAVLNNDAFPFLYNFVYGEKKQFSVAFKTGDGAIQEVTVRAAFFEENPCGLPGNNPKSLLEVSYHDSTSAVMSIRTFSKDQITGSGQDFERFLDSTFRELKVRKVRTLILDLRGNGGGDDVYGALLYAFLTDRPFRYFLALRSREKPVFTEEDHPGLAVQSPAAVTFNGKLIILTDGRTFSTAADFCAVARSNRRGIFVGEETGGGYEGNNSGGSRRTVLAHSGVQVAVPTIRYTNAVVPPTLPGRGIIPDYEVIPGVSDVLAGKDPQMQQAQVLAEQSRRN